MGILSSGNKVNVEEEVRKAFYESAPLEYWNLMMKSEECSSHWINTVQGYYDSRHRTVIATTDSTVIFYGSINEIKQNNFKGESLGIKYTDMGYSPMTIYSKDGNSLNLKRVIEIWTEVVKENLERSFPEYETLSVTNYDFGEGYIYFEYILPALQWKSWF